MQQAIGGEAKLQTETNEKNNPFSLISHPAQRIKMIKMDLAFIRAMTKPNTAKKVAARTLRPAGTSPEKIPRKNNGCEVKSQKPEPVLLCP